MNVWILVAVILANGDVAVSPYNDGEKTQLFEVEEDCDKLKQQNIYKFTNNPKPKGVQSITFSCLLVPVN
jgi:hypothetical protein